MNLKDMFKKTSGRSHYISLRNSRPEVPTGLLRKCNKCGAAIIAEDVKNGYYICPKCHGYFRVHAYRRIEMIADEGSFEEWDKEMDFVNPLDFRGYEEKIHHLKERTNLNEAVVTGKVLINGNPAVVGVCDGRFMMASMGWIVGEKIARAVERATQEKLPVIIFTCSGGARMQEGIVSLMQMAKTSAALKKHSDAGQLYVSVLTDPTTGGVTASFAMLGDIILAEPKALIGFAGPRVIEQTIGQKLPKGFQRSEFLLDHGFVDRIVEREELKDVLSQILEMHHSAGAAEVKAAFKKDEKTEDKSDAITGFENNGQAENMAEQIKDSLSAWDRVQISRKKDRPVGTDYIDALFTDFMEFHGDRYYKDDHAIVGGIAYFHGIPVTVIAQAKGKTTKENLDRNFSMPSPDGYRKALRLMKQAEKFGRPVICFVDTPGAFCGLEAEERGQGEAIARNLFELSGLKVPVLSVVIGEGGSGGALAMAVADEVWMLENAVYSVLSPEGFASILWKDSKRASEAAEVMKLTAGDLKRLGIIEQVISEPEDFDAENMEAVCEELEGRISSFLADYTAYSSEELTARRYDRFRKM
ncbi:acetyl-CoA carboxylase carboxyltransferase subunit beta [Mediterraneibacter catenae]|uniref:Multifunctional fusion protein n=1 Tax=Mediterraneibacter catenae TaxID=2594882 RepID=A0A5M9I0L3_9FIRM|nr:acetyl-CoA carboxylase carboxyltransferase subunit alpha [Mediterraneibacter catenae]KAA8501346.1 acetyl-CoA carboxylase carboxyltransferase subunit beta [Mediterraneibacter catenae]OUO31101.1 acetyl-CoA carboxylase carboxyl transferase subunit beta [Lachnoclostridium sp. An298]